MGDRRRKKAAEAGPFPPSLQISLSEKMVGIEIHAVRRERSITFGSADKNGKEVGDQLELRPRTRPSSSPAFSCRQHSSQTKGKKKILP